MNKLLAFHTDPKIKEKYIKRVKDHQKADEIIQGYYWENGKGCAVGCTIESSNNPHETMEKELGIPKELAFLEDALFEELSNGEAKEFPLKFLQAIPVGADLSQVIGKYVIWQFEDKKHGMAGVKEINEDKETMDICKEVVTLYKRKLASDNPTEKEWLDVANRADKLYWAWAGAGAWAWARARAGAGAGAWARARDMAVAEE